MIEFKPRMWTLMGASAMALASLAACQPSGETGTATATTNSVTPATVKGGEGEGEGTKPAGSSVSAGGESGEAGAMDAYSAIPETSHFGLRVAHLGGFLLIAEKTYEVGQSDEASVLIGQGLLEVYDTHKPLFDTKAPNVKPALDAVVAAIDAKKPKQDVHAAIKHARDLIAASVASSGAADQDVLRGLLSIASGLYSGVVTADGNDPIEYQHAYGAVLAAKDEFDRTKGKLSQKDASRTAQLGKDLDALSAAFPAFAMPDTPAPVAQIVGAASRAELALSGIR